MIPIYTGTIPSRTQSPDEFAANAQAYLDYLAGLAPHINTAAAELVALADVGVYSAATTYNIPDTVIGSNGMTYRCVGENILADDPVGSVSGDWVQLTIEGGGVPIGHTMGWPSETEPEDYFEEDGTELLKTAYPDLYAVLGTIYGETDGAGGVGNTHFRLRDTRGIFKRGWDHGSGVDPDAASRTDSGDGTTGDAVGTGQNHEYESHDHGYVKSTTSQGSTPTGTYYKYITAQNSATDSSGGNETRPINIYEMSVIKFR